jgi:transcriptional regulator with XRE-family HTH domain
MAMEGRRGTVLVDVEALRHELEVRGWSGADLALKASLSPTTVNAIMHSRAVTLRVVKKIARALDAEPVTPTLAALLPGRAT